MAGVSFMVENKFTKIKFWLFIGIMWIATFLASFMLTDFFPMNLLIWFAWFMMCFEGEYNNVKSKR